jgi:hypothetical protein
MVQGHDNRVLFGNRPLHRAAGGQRVDFWGNLLVCKSRAKGGILVDMEAKDLRLVERMAISYIADVGIDDQN